MINESIPNKAQSISVGQNPIGAEQQPASMLDPTIRALITAPESLSDAERISSIKEAKRLAYGGEKVIVTDETGQPRWGKEYTKPDDVFTFDGQIRGKFDRVPKDMDKWSPAMQIQRLLGGPLEGSMTHAIIETDDGQQLIIRRIIDGAVSADRQTFDVVSSSKETGRAGKAPARKQMASSMLRDVVMVPGERLTLGIDPITGEQPKTRGVITKITTFNMNPEGVVDPRHPKLSKAELQRTTIKDFGEKMRAIRAQSLEPGIGFEVLNHEVSADGEIVDAANVSAHTAAEVVAGHQNIVSKNVTDLSEVPATSELEIDEKKANQIFETRIQQFVQGVHTNAKSEGRPLNVHEIQQIKNLVEVVKQRRGVHSSEPVIRTTIRSKAGHVDTQLATYIQENGISMNDSSQRYEAEVQQFVQGIHERAKSERRPLTEDEIRQIKNAVETVNDLRTYTERAA